MQRGAKEASESIPLGTGPGHCHLYHRVLQRPRSCSLPGCASNTTTSTLSLLGFQPVAALRNEQRGGEVLTPWGQTEPVLGGWCWPRAPSAATEQVWLCVLLGCLTASGILVGFIGHLCREVRQKTITRTNNRPTCEQMKKEKGRWFITLLDLTPGQYKAPSGSK